MAEAVAGLSLAANVLQVADYGVQFVNTAWKIWKSGRDAIDEFTDLHRLSKSLKEISQQLLVDIPDSKLHIHSNKGIVELAGQCNEAAQEILDSLNRIGLPIQRRKRDAAKAAFKVIWGANDIKALQTKLEGVRHQLVLYLVASIRYAHNRIVMASQY
jgi:hypothetical protein